MSAVSRHKDIILVNQWDQKGKLADRKAAFELWTESITASIFSSFYTNELTAGGELFVHHSNRGAE
jgi:hypothetical protein